MLHREAINEDTFALIKKLSADKQLKEFVLVGGTALALQLGHRRSIDIDLFTPMGFDSQKIGDHIRAAYNAEVSFIIKNGVFSLVQGIKTDMLAHQYKFINPPVELEGIRMASLEDIGAMKLHAIVQSGRRAKDFADMYYLLEHRSLNQLTSAYAMKYTEFNAAIAKNELLYHNDAKFIELVNLLIRPLKSQEIKKRMKEAVMSPNTIFKSSVDKSNKLTNDQRSNQEKRRGVRKRR